MVYPLREASSTTAAAEELKNAVDQAMVLASKFHPHGVPTRLLHGKMKTDEKAAALEVSPEGDGPYQGKRRANKDRVPSTPEQLDRSERMETMEAKVAPR